ncbi:SUZ domain-containing protein [Trichonephila inaurata madagascariensis]|uniref:SUZ RNA-binding domain-containing n=1 Tax=Trichonephila inaurata madagascariensis TaxID=2747483 RepID=A0A8X6XVA9_9ARAC|nr:SUZ domain-containing protein [Trichonephila inaurata madagascariensis]
MAQDVSDDVCDSWEDMIENGILEKKLEELQIRAPKNSASEDQSSETALYPQMKLEDSSRTPYIPQVKILKRPNDAKTVVVSEKSPSRQPAKTLQQREAEYAEARLRILGSASSEDEQSSSNSNSMSVASSEKRTEAEVVVVRLPRGPDGTNGFVQQR